MTRGQGRAWVGEEARGTGRDAEEGEGRAAHRATAAAAREALHYAGRSRGRAEKRGDASLAARYRCRFNFSPARPPSVTLRPASWAGPGRTASASRRLRIVPDTAPDTAPGPALDPRDHEFVPKKGQLCSGQ